MHRKKAGRSCFKCKDVLGIRPIKRGKRKQNSTGKFTGFHRH